MASRMHAVSLLALGLAVGVVSDAEAAPTTPPPPKAKSTTPPPPSASPKTTPPPPSSSKPSPFLPTPKSSGTGSTPPPPSSTPPPPSGTSPGGAEPSEPAEPEPPPQDLSHTWGYSQKRSDVRPRYVRTNDPAFAAPNPVGFYSGVSVQGNHVPPLPAKELGTAPAVMTWTGFERVGEGSRVFFQLSSAIEHEVSEAQDGLVLRIRMKNTRVNVKNNRRRLDLRYFKTPVSEVRIKHKGRDTIATISLKRAEAPRVELTQGKAGYTLLIVEFAEGAGPTPAPSQPPPPSPPAS